MKKIIIYTLFFLFANIVFSQTENCPCCTENHKGFDFWIGQWTVTNPDGTAAGKNSIKRIQNGCVIEENWTSVKGGYTGISHNFYNSLDKQWEQVWIDNVGVQLKLYGNRKGNQMILSSKPVRNNDGKMVVNRVTWTSNTNGTVRQLWEVLHDGKVANIAFDGLYKKQE